MNNILLAKDFFVRELSNNILQNLDLYRNKNFDIYLNEDSNFIETKIELIQNEINKVSCTPVEQNEVQCCLSMYRSMPGLNAYLARDQRLWVFLTHFVLLEYSRQRWPIPKDDEKAITHIKKHFFATGARGIERDNAASRLWWMASICCKVDGLSLEESLTAFLFQTDVRANIVERPTTSQNVNLLSAVIKKLDKSFRSDKALYDRQKFRLVMKELNLQGGSKLLEVLEPIEIKRIVDRVMR